MGPKMLLSPVRVARPELKDEVSGFVHQIRTSPAHATLPLVELVRLLGITVAPAFHAELAARGEIRIDQQRFENEGSAIRRRVRLGGVEMTLEVAPTLSGRVHVDGTILRLIFDDEHTVRLSKFVLRARLHLLTIHDDHIDVELRGGGGVRIDLV